MAQPLVALFWFAVGVAYLIFGWVSWSSVKFLGAEQEDTFKKAIIEETRLASRSPEEMQIKIWEAAAERKVQELLADPEVTKWWANEKVLRVGAMSFFFAGAISFVQGLSFVAGW